MTQTRQRTLQTFLYLAGLTALALGTLGAQIVCAQPFFMPTEDLKSVLIENTSTETQYLWVAVPADKDTDFPEVNLEIPAKKSLQYIFHDELKYPWVQLKSYDEASVKVTAYTSTGKTNIVEGRSESLISPLAINKSQGTLILANLSPIAQDGIILNSSPYNRRVPLTLNLPKFGVEKVALSVERGDRIRISAKYPVAATYIANSGAVTSLRPDRTITEFATKPDGVYFEMMNNEKDESFIFFTADTALIQEARHQVQNPLQRKILFAKIQKGHDQTNRNLASVLKTPWSWSVAEAQGFGYFGSLACDGSPALVEDFLIPWLTAEQGICFWGYHLQRELNPYEVQTGYSPQ